MSYFLAYKSRLSRGRPDGHGRADGRGRRDGCGRLLGRGRGCPEGLAEDYAIQTFKKKNNPGLENPAKKLRVWSNIRVVLIRRATVETCNPHNELTKTCNPGQFGNLNANRLTKT